MRKAVPSLLSLVLTILIAVPGSANEARPVVEVLVSFQEYDASLPWQREPTKDRRGFGLMLNDAVILTTEALVRNQTLIEIRRPRSGRKETARLIQADPQIGLALLALAAAPGIPVTSLPPVTPPDAATTTASILQITAGGEPQEGNGRIVQWKVDELPNTPYSALLGSILTDLNIDGTGAPVYAGNRLAGITLSYHGGSRTALMLPAMFIQQFIDDVQSPPYDGFASAGIAWQPLIDDTKRAYFGIPAADTGGIQVLGVLPGANGKNPLQPNDIILAINATPIDAQGYYNDPVWGRLTFAHMIKGYHRPGERIEVKLIRERQIKTESVVLARFDDDSLLIPENPEGLPEPYLVDGGFVIRELTGRMIMAPGKQWTLRTDPRLAHLYLARQTDVQTPGERVVILSTVLPDPINIGYQHLRDEVIRTVNGTAVTNLREVLAAVDREGGIRRLGLLGSGVEIALDPASLSEANARISTQYRIPQRRREPVPQPVPPPRT
jgi:S1-C subfamily serine protease